jgi:uncharacterized protein with GYD domain
MAIYITQGRYTPDAVKGMVANPENREKAVADLMEKAGAKLLDLYFTFGEYDFLSISEAPSEEVMASALHPCRRVQSARLRSMLRQAPDAIALTRGWPTQMSMNLAG